jgi:MFS family permease
MLIPSTQDRPTAIAAAITLGLAGSAIPVIIPIMINAIARYRGLDVEAAASVMSGELLGTTVATGVIATVIGRINRRWLGIAALVACALADLASMEPVTSVSTLYALRFAAGLGEGALIALSSSTLARTAQTDRNFAIFLVANTLLSALMIRAAPTILAEFGVDGAFGGLLLLRLLAFLALPFLPTLAPTTPVAKMPEVRRVSPWNREVVQALLGILLLFTAVGTIWPLMPQFAARFQLSDAAIASTLSNATLVGLFGALSAGFLGARIGRWIPILAGSALLVGSLLLLGFGGAPSYGIVAAMLMGAWMFSIPYYLATLAAAEPTGRAVAFSMSLQFCGMAMGPLLGPRINHYLDGYGAAWAAIFMLTISALLMVATAPRKSVADAGTVTK